MNEPSGSKYAIHEAAREGRTSVVESLLNVRESLYLPLTTRHPLPRRFAPLSILYPLTVLLHAQANPRLADTRDEDARLPIHWAVSYNHPAIVRLLVQTKTFDADAQDGSGWTALLIASSLRDGDELVDLFLSKGADVNAKNFSGQTALHFCASKNNLEVARTLIRHKASTRIKDKRDQLPIHRAAAVGSAPMTQLLIDHKSPLNATDSAGHTALHHAISEGHGDTAMLLLRAGAESDKQDTDGKLAIQLAPDQKIRKYILQSAEREGIDVVTVVKK